MKKYDIVLLLLVIFLLLNYQACSKKSTASLESPDTEILYPQEGDTMTIANVECRWRGLDNAKEFAYRLDDAPWSSWGGDTTKRFILDEGEHQLIVKARNEFKREDPSPASVNFFIDAVKGPSLWIKSRKIEVSTGGTCSLKVYAEDIENLMLANLELLYDNTKIRINNVSKDTLFLEKNGASVQMISEYNDTSNILSVNIGLVGGQHKGVSGSGPLFTVGILVISADSTEVLFSPQTELRDTLNNNIILTGMFGCSIVPE